MQPVINFCNSSLFCYVVGVNPTPHIMEGFISYGGTQVVNKVSHGVSIVHFRSMEKRDHVLANNQPFFNNKPFILKAWSATIDIIKEDIKTLPTWVHLLVDLKYWGEKCIYKIAGQLGNL